ncbi:MAG TPA: DUF86 domain-containing protein [Planctomycetota bacterium]|nr:DUF86 domain-containing protein [Planctomycetota bacterium]
MTTDEVLAKAQTVRQNLDDLGQIPQGSYDEFGADARNLHATLHLLQTSIQALIDIGSLHCARLGLRTPRSSHEVFVSLEADGRLPKGTADRMAPMVGFRNRVVHLYDRIDPARVYEVLTRHRDDLADCLRLLLTVDPT